MPDVYSSSLLSPDGGAIYLPKARDEWSNLVLVRVAGDAELAGGTLAAEIRATRWDGPTDMTNGDGEPVVVHLLLKQDGAKISGGLWTEDHDESNPRPVQNGSLEGTKLRFEVLQKADAVITFELALTADRLGGVARFQGPNGAQEIHIVFHRPPGR